MLTFATSYPTSMPDNKSPILRHFKSLCNPFSFKNARFRPIADGNICNPRGRVVIFTPCFKLF